MTFLEELLKTAVMDGDIDGFINEYLRKSSLGTLGQE